MNSSNEPVESLSSSLLCSLSFNEIPSGSEDVLLERLLLSEEWLLLLSLSIMFSTKLKIMNCCYVYEYRIFKGHNKIYHRIFTGYLRGIKIHHNFFHTRRTRKQTIKIYHNFFHGQNNYFKIRTIEIIIIFKMNSKFTKLTSDLDCPNPNCQGWLNVYAKKGDTRPCFLRCANSSKNDNGDCNVSTIFSVKQSTCPACNKPIHKVT